MAAHQFRAMRIFAAICLLAAPCVGAGNIDAEPQGITPLKQLMDQGRYQQALEGYIRLYHRAQDVESMQTLRLHYALQHWITLGKRYPPAFSALLTIRNALKSQILRQPSRALYCAQLSAINRALQQQQDSVVFFRQLADIHPRNASSCFPAFQSSLINAQDYGSLKRFGYDPVRDFNHALFRRDTILRFVDGRGAANRIIIDKIHRDFRNRTHHIIQTAAAIGDSKSASQIRWRTHLLYNRAPATPCKETRKLANRQLLTTFCN